MIVTAKLLKKYHAGECSDEECLLVQHWLENNNEGLAVPSGKIDKESQIKDQMWDNIASFIDEEPLNRPLTLKSVNRLQPLRYLAAACLIFAAIFWGLRKDLTSDGGETITVLSMDNLYGASSKKINNAGLAFTLTPKSKAETHTNLKNNSASVNFCGNILITNNSDQDIQIHFNTICQNASDSQKVVTCEKGKTYVAVHYKYNDDEIMIFDKADLANSILPIKLYEELERI